MSSTFDDLAAGAAVYGRALYAKTVTHTATDGQTTEVTDATFGERPGPRVTHSRTGAVRCREALATVPQATVALVAIGETITVDAEVWSIVNYAASGGGTLWDLDLVHAADLERANEGYRIGQ